MAGFTGTGAPAAREPQAVTMHGAHPRVSLEAKVQVPELVALTPEAGAEVKCPQCANAYSAESTKS